MPDKIYMHLLILCGILCHEIIATLSDNTSIKESSDFLVRKKRVISHYPEDQRTIRIEEAYYIVNIKEHNRMHCVGTILSLHNVLTAARCVQRHESIYTIFSGGAYDQLSNIHNVTSKISYFGNPPHDSFDGIAIVTVDPPFVFSPKTGRISLFTGLLSPSTEATVHGWGCNYPPILGPRIRSRLRSITVPIINNEQCQNIYRRQYAITEKYICTYHGQKYCAHKDVGTPLIVNDKLAGVHVWKGEHLNQMNPDVFVNVLRPDYSEWIREQII